MFTLNSLFRFWLLSASAFNDRDGRHLAHPDCSPAVCLHQLGRSGNRGCDENKDRKGKNQNKNKQETLL